MNESDSVYDTQRPFFAAIIVIMQLVSIRAGVSLRDVSDDIMDLLDDRDENWENLDADVKTILRAISKSFRVSHNLSKLRN